MSGPVRASTPASVVGLRRVVMGVAEDGAAIRCDVRPGDLDDLDEHWPRLGLTRLSSWTASRVIEHAAELDLDIDDGRGRWVRAESELARFAAEHLVGRVAVHAAVVGFPAGVIVIPGPSYAGKTTLALALRDAGGIILSDEYAVVDPVGGRVVGWDRPLHRRGVDGSVDRLDVVSSNPPQRVALIAAVRYDPGARAAVAVASPGSIARTLIANTVGARLAPGPTFRAASLLARTAPGVEGVRADSVVAADALVERVRGAAICRIGHRSSIRVPIDDRP